MKKFTVLMLALLMTLFAVGGALAETAVPNVDETLAVTEPVTVKEYVGEGEEVVRASNRSDLVEIDGNSYGVITGENIGIAYEAPNSSIYVLTQDYLRQANTYDLFYSNPFAAASSLAGSAVPSWSSTVSTSYCCSSASCRRSRSA